MYAEGLASGFLQHWSTSDENEMVDDVLVVGSTIVDQLVPTDPSITTPDTILYPQSSDDIDDEDDEIIKGESTALIPHHEDHSDVSHSGLVDHQKNPLRETSLSSTSILPPRLLDLHGFPLPVAKAAIDYMLKELYQEFGKSSVVVDEGLRKVENGQMRMNSDVVTRVKRVDFDVHVVTGRGRCSQYYYTLI